ncbi:MAG: nicotinate-nucleotide--dimethylbenzimidazole phosphoribosyltransferase [Oscillospiraceae bacterium]|nr:nicotinate-nucleotide--dimethylbenzimidazole phosphoribosyltransferase [Oscillospiraceae bacterium]
MEYTEQKLKNIIAEVPELNRDAMSACEKRQAALAKPPGSLGKLEEISIQLAGITGSVKNTIEKRRIIVMCADNGVFEEGVSSSPQSVTLSQTINLTKGITGCSCLAKHFGNEVVVCDVGVNAAINCPEVIDRKIAMGTKNLVKEPAMTRQQAIQGILTGVEMADIAKADGVKIVGVGEMGICNTTTSSAVLAVLTESAVEDVTGRGGGVTDAAFLKKKQVIATALELHKPDKNDVLDVLSKVGGFDIAAMCGVFLGCAKNRIPVVVDGFISIVAALCAVRLCENVRGYLIPSHHSYELGYQIAAKALEFDAYLMLGMRLGEGSGCPIAFEIVDAACAVINTMATFEEAEINDDYLTDIRKADSFTVV